MLPPFVITTSPEGARDILSLTYPFVERSQPIFAEHRRLLGGSLLNFEHDAWLPRRRALQPVFTKQHVTRFAGRMAACAREALSNGWSGGDNRPRSRVPPLDSDGAGSIGARLGPRRTGICGAGRAASHRRELRHRSLPAAGPRPVVAADRSAAARTRCRCHLPSACR